MKPLNPGAAPRQTRGSGSSGKVRKWDQSTKPISRLQRGVRGTEQGRDFVTVLAFDPGGTTGWSRMTVRVNGLLLGEPILKCIVEWEHGQIDCGSKAGGPSGGSRSGGMEASAQSLGGGSGGVGGVELGVELGDLAGRGGSRGRGFSEPLSGADSTLSLRGEFAGVDRCLQLAERDWVGFGRAAIVVEDFILRQQSRARDLLSPVRITAAFGYGLSKLGRGYFLQTPADAKVTFTDERLKAVGFYEAAGAMRHARDADRHALLFLTRCVGKTAGGRNRGRALRMQAWPERFVADGAGGEIGGELDGGVG